MPYGDTWFQKGSTNNAPKYNSQELDKESGYYYFNARYYDAKIGRFITPDSVIDGEFSVAGWNRYMYCHGNPVLYKDPSGHDVKLKEDSRCLSKNEKRQLFTLHVFAVASGYKKTLDEAIDGNPRYEIIQGLGDYLLGRRKIREKVTLVKANDIVIGKIVKGYKAYCFSNKNKKKLVPVYDYDVQLFYKSLYGKKNQKVKLSTIINKEYNLDQKRASSSLSRNLPSIIAPGFQGKISGKVAGAVSDGSTIYWAKKENGFFRKIFSLMKGSSMYTAYQDGIDNYEKYRWRAVVGLKAFKTTSEKNMDLKLKIME